MHRYLHRFLPLFLVLDSQPASATPNWQLIRRDVGVVQLPSNLPVAEMSGVTYVGPVEGQLRTHRFLTANENYGALLQFDLIVNIDGSIGNFNKLITGATTAPLNSTNDFEGIAYTNAARNSVFLSDETGPNVREYSLATGNLLQSVAIPPLFSANMRGNRGFESLARSRDGATLWTANEEALTVDGPVATTSASTTVRLLKLSADGTNYLAGTQYAYQVDAIQSPGNTSSQSGLVDLTVMPDGTLLVLERSFSSAAFPTIYRNRIYEVGFTGATDVSAGPFAAGLSGQSSTPVTKTLVWSGIADALVGQNLEGLTLGPRLPNGDWVLVGVVDNAANDPVSDNTLVTFVLRATPSADFNQDGAIDAADYTVWRDNSGIALGATTAVGDADRDGDVDTFDWYEWQNTFAANPASGGAVPEPAALALLACCTMGFSARRALRRARSAWATNSNQSRTAVSHHQHRVVPAAVWWTAVVHGSF